MEIAISGGSGFIGRKLVQTLLAGGHRVRVLSRHPERARLMAADLPANSADRFSARGYNPLERQSWSEALDGCDGVVHLAGRKSCRRTLDRPEKGRDSAQSRPNHVPVDRRH